MFPPIGFTTWSNYFRFTLASEFVDKETGQTYSDQKSFLERTGKACIKPIFYPLDFLLREIKNPMVLISLTIICVAIATIIFYPVQFTNIACTILPILSKIKPWMIKFGAFVLVEITITGVGLRALGRLNDKQLREKWDEQKIHPIFIGVKK